MEKIKFGKPSAELIKLLDTALLSFRCDRRLMFGAPVFMINRNMFAGVFESSIFIRLSEKDRLAIQKKHSSAHPFEPVKGHAMKEYIVLSKEICENTGTLTEWLKSSWGYAASLPPKAGKKKK